jgi:hypothetical protein
VANALESEAIREPQRFFLKKFSLREPHLLTLFRFSKKMKRETTPQVLQ